MEWIQKGIIYNKFHGQVLIVDIHHTGFWRLYYSQRVGGQVYLII